MVVAALSTGNKIGLALVGAAFIVFALVSSFLIPALRPDYPTRRGLPAFLTVTVALFVAMMFAVFFLARESEEGRAEGGAGDSEPASTQPPSETTPTPSTTAPTATEAETPTASVPTTAPTAPQAVPVTETEFKISLPQKDLSPGSYRFELKNDGQAEHDLVVKGPGVEDEKTPVIAAGKTAALTVDLKSGTYELYCSVPGHKQAGMDLKISVG